MAGVGLQADLANQANRTDVSITNQNMNDAAGLTMELFVQEILQLKFLAKDYHFDDDVSANSHSDSGILGTIEKADFVKLYDDDSSSTLAGFEEELSTVHFS